MRIERFVGPDQWRALPILLRSLYFILLAMGTCSEVVRFHSQAIWLKWEEIFEENCL